MIKGRVICCVNTDANSNSLPRKCFKKNEKMKHVLVVDQKNLFARKPAFSRLRCTKGLNCELIV